MKYSISLGKTINVGDYNSIKVEVWHEFDENTNTFAAYDVVKGTLDMATERILKPAEPKKPE